MQGVFTKFLQLWIPNKTDKGTVVTDVFEPNFTKLDQNAESTNKTLTELESNKLDKGTYTKTASDLDNSKYDKTGGKLTGTVILDTPAGANFSRVDFKTAGVDKGYVGRIEDVTKGYIGLHNYITDKYMRTFDDGTTEIGANNLNTPTKEVIMAINEELTFITNNAGRKIGDLFYIQNVGTKNSGEYYFDRNTYGLYRCVNTTATTNNDSNFINDSNYVLSLVSRDAQAKINALSTSVLLYSNPLTGAGTSPIPVIQNYNLSQLTVIISSSSSTVTHNRFSVLFSPSTRFDWADNQHALGAIAISVINGNLTVGGAGAGYVKIENVYGIGYKGA